MMKALANQSEGTPTHEDESSACMSARLNPYQKRPLQFEIQLDLKSLGHMIMSKMGIAIKHQDKEKQSPQGHAKMQSSSRPFLEEMMKKFDFQGLGDGREGSKGVFKNSFLKNKTDQRPSIQSNSPLTE